MNIRTKQIFIKISVKFDEPLQEVELVEENSAEIPSCSADNLGDESGSEGFNFEYMIYNISEKNISVLESYSEMPNHLPIWPKKTLSSVRQNIGNSTDPRRTQSDFQRACIALSCPYSLLFETCYLIIGSDPKSYYHAQKHPIWQAAMDEEFNSL